MTGLWILCPECAGEGRMTARLVVSGDPMQITCRLCDGAGRILDRRTGRPALEVRPGLLGILLAALSGAIAGVIVTLALTSTVLAAPRAASLPTAPTPSSDVAGFALASPGPAAGTSGVVLPGAPQAVDVSPVSTWPAQAGSQNGGAPQLEGEIGSALTAGWASWYPCSRGWCDVAHVAMPGATYRTPRQGPDGFATVTIVLDGEVRSGTFPVVDACGCGDRGGVPTVVDLSLEALRELGLYDVRSRDGIWRAEVSWTSDGPRTTLPPTDLEEPR